MATLKELARDYIEDKKVLFKLKLISLKEDLFKVDMTEDVFLLIKKYNKKKGFNFTSNVDTNIQYLPATVTSIPESSFSVSPKMNQKNPLLSYFITESPSNLEQIQIELCWDQYDNEEPNIDVNASVFMLNRNGKVPNNSYFVFYNQTKSPEGSIVHNGVNFKDSFKEEIEVNLSDVPPEIQQIVITTTIHEANKRNHNFGQLKYGFIRIVNKLNGKEILRINLDQDFAYDNQVVLGKLYRSYNNWYFRYDGEGDKGELKDICSLYGLFVN